MTKDSQRPSVPWRQQKPKKLDDDDGDEPPETAWGSWRNVTVAAIPQITGLALRTVLGVTVALYVLNQKHMLPRQLGAVVSKTLFWPTLPITASKRIGKWITRIDETVVMGGAPFGFLNYPEQLYEEYGVRNSQGTKSSGSMFFFSQ
jgi:hypothetical protein